MLPKLAVLIIDKRQVLRLNWGAEAAQAMGQRLSYRKKITFLILLAFLLQILVSTFVLYEQSLAKAKEYIHRTAERVKKDITYQNEKWDISRYIADGEIPDINPLYIITSDGYIIERWKHINGLLDVSEFSRLISYTKPETITTVTNESWRILSKQIVSNGKTLGVITVTAYKPELSDIAKVDNQLASALTSIESDIVIWGDEIDVSKVDARKLPYTITFQVVNRFNKVLHRNDNTTSLTRSPTYIDSSYVDNQKNSGEKIVHDSVTNKAYLTLTTPLYDSKHSIAGIIVVGSPVDSYMEFLRQYTIVLVGITAAILVLLLPLILNRIDKAIEKTVSEGKKNYTPKSVIFYKKDCKIKIDNNWIDIPYASFQYYFCNALFSNPNKRWEVDELLHAFGERIDNKEAWRKIYDTMVALNKKTDKFLQSKLFIVKDKTYSINKSLTSKTKLLKS